MLSISIIFLSVSKFRIMEFKGTKGEWVFETIKGKSFLGPVIFGKENGRIVTIFFNKNEEYPFDTEEFKANAVLISKAPKLLKALQELVIVSKDGYVQSFEDTKEGFLNWEKEIQEKIVFAEMVLKEALEEKILL